MGDGRGSGGAGAAGYGGNGAGGAGARPFEEEPVGEEEEEEDDEFDEVDEEERQLTMDIQRADLDTGILTLRGQIAAQDRLLETWREDLTRAKDSGSENDILPDLEPEDEEDIADSRRQLREAERRLQELRDRLSRMEAEREELYAVAA